MAEPQETVTKFFRLLDAASAIVEDAVIGDFVVVALMKAGADAATAWAHASTLEEPVAGHYAWTYTLPSEECHEGIHLRHSNSAYQIEWLSAQGELERRDLVSVFNAASRPVVTLSGQGTIGQTVEVSLVARRYRVLRFIFEDEDGEPIDMTEGEIYDDYAWAVRAVDDQTDADALYDQTTNITAGEGFVEVEILETADFFDALPEGAAVEESVELRHELVADLVDEVGQTVSLVPSSVLRVTRREKGTGAP